MTEYVGDELWDESASDYYQLGNFLKAVAERDGCVHIDPLTLARWREMMGLIRELDTQADEVQDGEEHVLEALSTFDRFRGRYPHLDEPVLIEKIAQRVQQILKLGSFVAQAETPFRYARLRAAEAVATAELFADVTSSAVSEQPEFHTNFMPLMRELGIAASLLDSAHDIADDYYQSKSSLKPSILNKTRLLSASVYHARFAPRAALSRTVLRETWVAARIHGKHHYESY